MITNHTPGVVACCCSKKLGLNTSLSMIKAFRQASLLFNDGWVCLEYRVAHYALQSRTYVWLFIRPFHKWSSRVFEITVPICLRSFYYPASSDFEWLWRLPLYPTRSPLDLVCIKINYVRQRVTSHVEEKRTYMQGSYWIYKKTSQNSLSP